MFATAAPANADVESTRLQAKQAVATMICIGDMFEHHRLVAGKTEQDVRAELAWIEHRNG